MPGKKHAAPNQPVHGRAAHNSRVIVAV